MTEQDQEVAQQLLVKYLAWAEKKHAQDQKQLKSILEAWGFPMEGTKWPN